MGHTAVSLTDLANQVIAEQGVKKLGFEDAYATVSAYNTWHGLMNYFAKNSCLGGIHSRLLGLEYRMIHLVHLFRTS